jgi:hypothetical protein
VVGGSGPSLPPALAVRLAGEYLKADRLPATVRVSGPQIPAADGEGAAPAEIASLMRAAGLPSR